MSVLMKGIDVSYCQSNVNWSHVKCSGIQFALIRAGYGRVIPKQIDSQFENNYAGCKSNGIPCGAYWYSYALSESEAIKEAQCFLEVIKGKTFEFPVYFDMEEPNQFELGKSKCSAIAKAFMDTVQKAGYFVGLYMSTSYLNQYITEEIKNNYAIWVAQYNSECTYKGQYGIWQYGVAGHPKHDTKNEKSIYGVNGQCDCNLCYIDYPTIIKGSGLNGFTKTPTPTPTEPGVKTYSNTDSTQLTPHFNTAEFKCKCGKSHDTLINTKLVEMLEKLREKLHCSKIVITSGYRCPTHDKNVGGTGSGHHTKGNAADLVCYDNYGNVISSRIICCVAQDLGFTGIANITSDYQAVHLDVRSGSKWYGNEVLGNQNVTNDFYSYYGIRSSDVEVYTNPTTPSEPEESKPDKEQTDKSTYTVLKNGTPFMEIKEL